MVGRRKINPTSHRLFPGGQLRWIPSSHEDACNLPSTIILGDGMYQGFIKVFLSCWCHKELDRWIKYYDLGWHIFLKDMIIKLKFSGATVGAKVPKDVREELADPPSITVDLDLLGLVQVNALTQHEFVEVPDLPWTWHGQTWSNPSRGQCDECESLIKQVPVREDQQWNGMFWFSVVMGSSIVFSLNDIWMDGSVKSL